MSRAVLDLRFSPDVDHRTRRRIRYALGLFALSYDYSTHPRQGDAPLSIGYGIDVDAEVQLAVEADATSARPDRTIETFLRAASGPDASEETRLRSRDHLAEIFCWAARPLELSSRGRDEVGRIPFEGTTPGLLGMDQHIPWANRAMERLNGQLRARWPQLPERAAPIGGKAALLATHDIDFLAGRWPQTLQRYGKNLALAAAVHREPGRVESIVRAGVTAMGRRTGPLDRLGWLADIDRQRGIRADWYVLCRRAAHRDANYTLDEPRTQRALAHVVRSGASVGVHGSYTSLEAPGRLAEEYEALRQLGHAPLGGRQHWLRYDDNTLFRELEASGAMHDSTVGFSDRVGFRHGLASPFPIYDVERDRVVPVLEFPLVAMDVALDRMRRGAQPWRQALDAVLDGVRTTGIGGVSIVWHDTVFGGTQIDDEVAEAYFEVCSQFASIDASTAATELRPRLAAAFPDEQWPAAPDV